MKYKKLIGYIVDTNQFTLKIENVSDAIQAVSKLIKIYGIEVLNEMYLTSDSRFSTFTKKEYWSLSLCDHLK
jgi:hypothetical protein